MAQESKISETGFIPAQALPPCADAFTSRIYGLLDGQPKDDATIAQAFEGLDEMFDQIAAGLYNLASMLVGEGEDSVRLVEAAIANTEISACASPVDARQSSRRALSIAALETIAKREPDSLAAPEGITPAATCIEDDDLDAAGVSREEFERMIAGPDRDRVRKWLASLPTAMRTIFVLRAVAGFSANETATLLSEHGGLLAEDWNPGAVREFFRQGLCSLASQLIQASATHA